MKKSDFNADYRHSHKSEEHAHKYEGLVTEGRYYSVLWEWEQKQIKEIVDSRCKGGAGTALDFACGTGRIVRLLEGRFNKTVGLDISSAMVAQAEKKSRSTEFVVGDATEQADLVSDRFDLIISFRFFLNAQDELRKSVIAFMNSALKSDGVIIFNVHLQESSLQSKLLKLWWSLRKEQSLPTLSIEHMSELLQTHDISIVETRHYGVLPTSSKLLPLPRTLYSKVESWLSGKAGMRPYARNVICVCVKTER